MDSFLSFLFLSLKFSLQLYLWKFQCWMWQCGVVCVNSINTLTSHNLKCFNVSMFSHEYLPQLPFLSTFYSSHVCLLVSWSWIVVFFSFFDFAALSEAGKHAAFLIFSQCFFVWRERLVLVARVDSKKKVITGVQDSLKIPQKNFFCFSKIFRNNF